MFRSVWVWLTIGCAASPQPALEYDHRFRHTAPEPGHPTPYRGPIVSSEILDNGVTFAVVEREHSALFTVHVVVLAGSALDPSGLEGLGAAYAEALCPAFTVVANADSTTVSTTVLDAPRQTLQSVAQCLSEPTFDPVQLERIREALSARHEPLEEALLKSVYPRHPYGHPVAGFRETRAALTPDALRAYHLERFSAAQIAVLVLGPVSLEHVRPWVHEAFGDRTFVDPMRIPEAPAPSSLPVYVSSADSSRVVLAAGVAGVPRAHPDALALMVGAAMIGRRLAATSKAIDIRAGFELRRGPSLFRIQAIVAPEHAVDVLEEIRSALEAGALDPSALDHVRRDFANRLPGQLQTQESTAGLIGSLFAAGLPLDYFASLPDKLAELDTEDVDRAVRTYLDAGRLSFVGVGDPSLKPELEAAIRSNDGD